MSQEVPIDLQEAMRRYEVDARVHQSIAVGLGLLPGPGLCPELLISTFPDVLRDGPYGMFVINIIPEARRVDHSHPENRIRALVVALDLPRHVDVRRRPPDLPLFLGRGVPLPRIEEHVARGRLTQSRQAGDHDVETHNSRF